VGPHARGLSQPGNSNSIYVTPSRLEQVEGLSGKVVTAICALEYRGSDSATGTGWGPALIGAGLISLAHSLALFFFPEQHRRVHGFID